MSSINPNDPVVAVLKKLVEDYDQKLLTIAQDMQDALLQLAQGNAATFQVLLQRLSHVENRLNLMEQVEVVPRVDGEGSEL